MKVLLPDVSLWRHELCECMYNCVGTVLLHYKQNPTFVLGAVWDFYYPPGDVRHEEYYYPCRWPSLVSSLAPYHPITSQWHEPVDAEQGWHEVKEAVQQGKPVIVAVDNYYLPFRPAYTDVHTNHLIVLYGFDEDANCAYVLDASPPSFSGPLRLEELHAARNSQNIAVHERDMFYTNAPIANRWLDIELHGPFPEITKEWVVDILAQNLQRFRSPSESTVFSGIDGMKQYFMDIYDRATGDNGATAMEELAMVSDVLFQSTAVHADFLAAVGARLNWHQLVEVARQVERLAHHSVAIRAMAARGRTSPATTASRLMDRFNQLLSDQQHVLHKLEWLIAN